MTLNLLDIIGYILILSIWISMYIRNKKVKNNEITTEIAEKWEMINFFVAVAALSIFLISLFCLFYEL